MSRLAFVGSLMCTLPLAGCSLVFSGDDLRGDAGRDADLAPDDGGPNMDAQPPPDAAPDAAPDASPDAAPDASVDAGPPDCNAPCVMDGGVDDDCDGFCEDVDCDDTRMRVFPGAPRICGDGVINDCDARGGVPPSPTDAERLRGLLGEVVPDITVRESEFTGDSKGLFDAAIAPTGPGTPNVLSVLASSRNGFGFELRMGGTDDALSVQPLSDDGCFSNTRAPEDIAVAADRPGEARFVFARSTGGMDAEPWRRAYTATWNSLPGIEVSSGFCRRSGGDTHTTEAAGALADSGGETLAGTFGFFGPTDALSCLAVGTRVCTGTTVEGTSLGVGTGVGGLMLGATRVGARTRIWARDAMGTVSEFADVGDRMLNGRMDAAYLRESLVSEQSDVVVVASAGDTLIVQQERCSLDCSTFTGSPVPTLAVPGRVPPVDALVSIAPLGFGRFVIANRHSPTAIALSLFDTRESGPARLSDPVILDALRFEGRQIMNLQVVSGQNAAVRRIFAVLVVTSSDGAGTDTRLHRVRFSACNGT